MANMTPFGYGAINPEDEEILEQMIRRVNMAGGDPATVKAGGEAYPFGGMGIAVQDMPKGQARLPNGEAPATTPWRTTFERAEPLEQGATPQKMSVPQTAPVTQQQRQAQAGPPSEANPKPAGQPMAGAQRMPAQSGAEPMSEPNFWDRLGAFSQGYNKGGLVGAVAAGMGTGLDREVEGQNMTLDALVKAGIDPKLASAAIRNPDLMKVLLQYQAGKSTPDLKTIKQRDEYGREREIQVAFNPRTNKWERVTIDEGQPAGPGEGGGGAPALPAPMPSMASGPSQTTGPGPAAPRAPGMAAPSTMPARPARDDDRYAERPVNVNTLPPPMKGYTYALGKNNLPLFDAQNNPKMVPEKSVDTANVADDAFKLREMIDGIDKTFTAANDLVNHPGLPDVAGRAFGGELTVKGIGATLPDIYPGTAQADAFNKHKALLSDVALRTMDRLKAQSAQGATGFGALSEKELEILTQSAGNLKLHSSYEELVENYQKFQSQLMKAREKLMSKYQDKYGEIPEGIVPKQSLIDRAAGDTVATRDRPIIRPREFAGFQIPFTQTTDPDPRGAPAQAAPRGIPSAAPPGARDLPPNSGYPPGSKASRDPNNPNRWIIWTPD
jgi:hypothetical protein